MLLDAGNERVEPVAASVVNRLPMRGWVGEDVLAEDLIARLRGEPLAGQALPLDLEELSMELEGDASPSTGGFVDLHTGELYNDFLADPAMVGEDAAIDVEEDLDRWLPFRCVGSPDG